MNDYVQRQWQQNFNLQPRRSKAAQFIAPMLGIVLVVVAVAYGLRDYWYPYISSYL